MQNEYLLELKDLRTTFLTENGPLTVVNGVSFGVVAGETLGIVGESGCGKSVTSESILRLLNEKSTRYAGEINYKNNNLLVLSKEEMRKIRGNEISMIFQDPMTSLNPVYTIGDQIAESIIIHQKLTKKEAYLKAIEMLRLTGIPSPEKRVNEYPHELSGGMRQRVMIAIALACEPNLLIADEPTTALDVTIQSQILDLIQDLKQKSNMGVILITHDLGVVAEICTRVVVMYLGEIIEEALVGDLFDNPLHPYTRGLLKSVPQLDGDRTQKLHVIKGTVPHLSKVPQGCRFAPRCAYATKTCEESSPELIGTGHKVRCWNFEAILQKEGELYAAQ
ncbi:peptide/nickel transport system ATP-binding protein [Paenibacillus sp. V4I9]|uniref:ABC transporter ATP-binding protein n=1 Tax=Paenibacillus sp. V4I9 TaxID=3042308 RepID=UPI0027841A63|nr:ABC transporter ATP-binding protein [Paenibacillus sp. V4I9]MDQ0889801.1 peptide/nickel transport system ATP-binding protein [Paenibacillus sp. V4I9]